jgi:protein-disulfide isomerase
MSRQERVRFVLDILSTTAMVVTSVFVVFWIMNNRSGSAANGGAEMPTPVETVDLVVSKGGHILGSEKATLAVIEFSDFQCPFCAVFARDTFPQLKRDFIDSGKVRFIYRHNPLEPLHSLAVKASTASQCADEQSRFWEMHDVIYASQRTLTDDSFFGLAKSLNLDAGRFSTCMFDPDALAKVKKDQAEASRLGLVSTPTFLIGRVRPDGTVDVTRRVNGAVPYETFRTALEDL